VQTLVLALTTIAAAALWFTGIVWLVSRSRAVVAGPRSRRRIDAIAGVTFLGLGARLAIG
jgi:threonine/homoserine/homoserine lactone efflux protein